MIKFGPQAVRGHDKGKMKQKVGLFFSKPKEKADGVGGMEDKGEKARPYYQKNKLCQEGVGHRTWGK